MRYRYVIALRSERADLRSAPLWRAPRGPGQGGLGEYWVCYAAVIIWTQLGPVTGNERDSSRKIPDARLHTTETETETETALNFGVRALGSVL